MHAESEQLVQRKWEAKRPHPLKPSPAACRCVCARTGRSRDFARPTLGSWAQSRRQIISRPRVVHGDVPRVAVDACVDVPSRVMCALALV
jgi:hypothetical protein